METEMETEHDMLTAHSRWLPCTVLLSLVFIYIFLFVNLVRTFWMEGLTRTEPAVSRACSAVGSAAYILNHNMLCYGSAAVGRACSAGPGPYLPIGIFLVIKGIPGIPGTLRSKSLACPHSRARSAPLTYFNWLRPLPRPQTILVRRLYISSAEASLTRARTGSRLGVRRSTSWATGWTSYGLRLFPGELTFQSYKSAG